MPFAHLFGQMAHGVKRVAYLVDKGIDQAFSDFYFCGIYFGLRCQANAFELSYFRSKSSLVGDSIISYYLFLFT